MLALRVLDFDTFYFLELIDDRIKLRKRSLGSTTDLTTVDLTPLAIDTWHTLRFSAIGTTLSVSLDGTPVATTSDAELVAGGIAFGANESGVAFDDVIATSSP